MSKKGTTAAIAAPQIDIGINGRDREKIAQGLSRVLADTYSLYLKTHNFHWNVEGPMFNTLHLMFMDQYTELWNALDAIAERIRSLGYPAPGTGKEFARLTSIDETEGVPEAAPGRLRRHARGVDAVGAQPDEQVVAELAAPGERARLVGAERHVEYAVARRERTDRLF